MISAGEAQELIAKHMPRWGEGQAMPSTSAALITSEPLIADRQYPPFNRATMDGIAVNWESYQAGQREFALHGVIAAGEPESELHDSRAALEIMTGAATPRNADLVIPYEQIKIEAGKAFVTEPRERARFENVHLRGSDCEAGAEILKSGATLNGPRWGIASSFGYETLRVQRLPRIKIISTGNELVGAGVEPAAHQIRRSNALALQASLRAHGYEEVETDHLPDDREKLANHFLTNTKHFDLLIYSGAVSKGKFDHLPQVWEECGVKKYFHGVSQRPGKPLWFGVDSKNATAVVGLPGNPISSLVCLHRYILPQREIYAALDETFKFELPLTYFLPVTVRFEKSGRLVAKPAGFRNSGEFSSLAETDGFLELPKGQGPFEAGQAFRFFSWRGL